MRLGLLGGTFDPVHVGHLVVAQATAEALGLDQVWLLPTGQPWMKRGEPLSGRSHRQAMAELAAKDDPLLEVCTLELDRSGDTYTVDTLEEIHARGDAGDGLWFIMGADTMEGFPRWKRPERILELATVAVAARPGYDLGAVAAMSRQVRGGDGRVVAVQTPLIEVSATDLRRRVAEGRPILHRVPDAVAAYIEAHGLYRERAGARHQA